MLTQLIKHQYKNFPFFGIFSNDETIHFHLVVFSLNLQLSCFTTPIESLPGAADSCSQQINPTAHSMLGTERTADEVSNLTLVEHLNAKQVITS